MEFTTIDFLTGFFLMNAMPHLLFGLFKIRFFSLFGFSAAGNLSYAFLNVLIVLVLFHVQYGIGQLAENGIIVGALAMFLIYLITGRFFYDLFQKDE